MCNGGQCRNTPGGFSCVCSGGLMMGPDASSCLDLDECIIEPEVCRLGINNRASNEGSQRLKFLIHGEGPYLLLVERHI